MVVTQGMVVEGYGMDGCDMLEIAVKVHVLQFFFLSVVWEGQNKGDSSRAKKENKQKSSFLQVVESEWPKERQRVRIDWKRCSYCESE